MRRFAYLVLLAAGCTTPPATGMDMAMGMDGGTPPDLFMADIAGSGMTLTGNRFYTEKALQLVSTTSDDYAIFLTSNNGASAVQLMMGATPKAITSTNTVYSGIKIDGKVVFAWSNTDMDNDGDLHVWTSAGASIQLNTKGASRQAFAQASDDAQYVLYSDGASATSTDVYLAKVDGSNAKLVLSNVSVDPNACYSDIGFAGGKFFVIHCDGAGTSATATTINPSDGTTKDIDTNVRPFFRADAQGTKVFLVEEPLPAMGDGGVPDAGNGPMVTSGVVMNPDGSGKVTVDSDVFYGFPLSGSAVLYGTSTPELKRSPIPNVMPTTLATTKFGGFPQVYSPNFAHDAVSPDGKYVIVESAGSGGISDLYLASTENPGTPATLSAKATSCIFNSAFTTDSSTALFYNTCASTMGLVVGTFMYQKVAGGMAVKVGDKVWNDMNTSKATQVVYNDNWKNRTGTNGRADIKVVDVAGAAPAITVIATQAEADFALNAAGNKVVFAYAVDNTKAGLYLADLP
jgi:hypothetical protein